MNIQIIRYRKKTETIDGHLLFDGQHICDTAENAKATLKAGAYPLNVVKCKQHSRKMPVLSLVSKFPCGKCHELECVSNNTTMPQICHMLKPGNGVYNRTDGASFSEPILSLVV